MRYCNMCAKEFINIGREVCCSIKCKVIEGSRKRDDGCWIWNKSTAGSYGKIRYKMKHYSAHRSSYESFIGPVPHGLWVCHKCDEPLCVNPEHLFLGSPSDNRQDALSKGRLSCIMGENNYLTKFTDAQVKEMRDLKNEGFSYARLKRIFNCSYSYINYIVNNKYRKE